MRQSVLPTRQSHISSQPVNPIVAGKLLEKKKEFEAVQALERASAKFLKRMEDLGDDFDVIADAGTVCGQVLEQWPNMFRILNLFLSSRETNPESDEAGEGSTVGQRLVRVPIEELQHGERHTS